MTPKKDLEVLNVSALVTKCHHFGDAHVKACSVTARIDEIIAHFQVIQRELPAVQGFGGGDFRSVELPIVADIGDCFARRWTAQITDLGVDGTTVKTASKPGEVPAS
jgi:hypothetical protein